MTRRATPWSCRGKAVTYKSYPLFVFGFHGCERSVAERVLAGEEDLCPSSNPYDWLGTGVYFWENAPERALKWARDQKKREPYAIGAVIQLSSCLNLMDTGSAEEILRAYDKTVATGHLLPSNTGKRHGLDMFIINLAALMAEDNGRVYDAVRGAFVEGEEIFPCSSIRSDTHIQLCVRNPACILAYFRPKEMGKGAEG